MNPLRRRRINRNLGRFLRAQNHGVYEGALGELRDGQKRSHWIWFIFPQLRGLGHSRMSYHYGIEDIDEARAYLRHPVLGQRLDECIDALFESTVLKSVDRVLGVVDGEKFRSSMMLFGIAARTNGDEERARLFFKGLHR